MKNIELTEEHKSKLLEMCKILFPEYINIEFDEDKLYFLTQKCFDINKKFGTQFSNEDCDFEIEEVYLEEYDVYIHWFEFCMTHLIVELSKEFTKQGLSKADYTNNQYPNWFSEKLSYHLNPFKNEEFEEDVKFIHPIDYLYEEFKKLK